MSIHFFDALNQTVYTDRHICIWLCYPLLLVTLSDCNLSTGRVSLVANTNFLIWTMYPHTPSISTIRDLLFVQRKGVTKISWVSSTGNHSPEQLFHELSAPMIVPFLKKMINWPDTLDQRIYHSTCVECVKESWQNDSDEILVFCPCNDTDSLTSSCQPQFCRSLHQYYESYSYSICFSNQNQFDLLLFHFLHCPALG